MTMTSSMPSSSARAGSTLSRTLSTMVTDKRISRSRLHTANLHPHVLEEFGTQFEFHTAQAEEIRSKTDEAESLRAKIKKLRAAAEDVAAEYERLEERTGKMNASVAALLEHFWDDLPHSRPSSVQGSAERMAQDGPSASAAAVIQRRHRRSKESLMRAVCAYLDVEEEEAMSGCDSAPILQPEPRHSESSTLDSELLTYMLLVVHELQQLMVRVCDRNKNYLQHDFHSSLSSFTKGDMRNARYQSQDFLKAYADYQQAMKTFNTIVQNSPLSPSPTTSEHASRPDSPVEVAESLVSEKTKRFSHLVNRIRGNHHDVVEAKKLLNARTTVINASEQLHALGEDCLVKFDLMEAASETSQFPRTIVAYIRNLRKMFEEGLQKCNELLSDADLDSIERMLLKRQKENTEAVIEKHRLRQEKGEEALAARSLPLLSLHSPPPSPMQSARSLESVMDSMQSSFSVDDPAPSIAPPLPPPKKASIEVEKDQPPPAMPAPHAPRTNLCPPPPPVASKPLNLLARAAHSRLETIQESDAPMMPPPVAPCKQASVEKVTVDCSSCVYVADGLHLSGSERSMARLLQDPELHLLQCMVMSSGGLELVPDRGATFSATTYRHVTSAIKIHECLGTLEKFTEHVLKLDGYRMVVDQLVSGPWKYPRISSDESPMTGFERYRCPSSAEEALVMTAIKQSLSLHGKYFLTKVVGGLMADIHVKVTDGTWHQQDPDISLVVELANKFCKDASLNRGLLPTGLRQLGHFVATRMCQEVHSPVMASHSTDRPTQFLTLVFFFDFLLPALRSPHEWNIAAPWDTKHVHRFYGNTHREHVSNGVVCKSLGVVIPPQQDQILHLLVRLLAEALSFITGVSVGSSDESTELFCGSRTGNGDANLDISIALAANSLVQDVETPILDFLKHMGQENRAMSKDTVASTDSIGGLLLSQEMSVFLDDHLLASAFKIRQWVQEREVKEQSIRLDDMKAILDVIQPSQLSTETTEMTGSDSSSDEDDERLEGTFKATELAAARVAVGKGLEKLSRSIKSPFVKN